MGKNMKTVSSFHKFEPFIPNSLREQRVEWFDIVKGEDNIEEQICLIDSLHIIWSRGGKIVKRLTFDKETDINLLGGKLIHACFAKFDDIPGRCIVVVQELQLLVYDSSGEVFGVPLPCRIRRVWPLTNGILIERDSENNDGGEQDEAYLPVLLSLIHPLEEPKPVATQEQYKYHLTHKLNNNFKDIFLCDTNFEIVYTDQNLPMIVLYHHQFQKHYIFWLRRAENQNQTSKGHGINPAVKKLFVEEIDQDEGEDDNVFSLSEISNDNSDINTSENKKTNSFSSPKEGTLESGLSSEVVLEPLYIDSEPIPKLSSCFFCDSLKHSSPLFFMHHKKEHLLRAFRLNINNKSDSQNIKHIFNDSISDATSIEINMFGESFRFLLFLSSSGTLALHSSNDHIIDLSLQHPFSDCRIISLSHSVGSKCNTILDNGLTLRINFSHALSPKSTLVQDCLNVIQSLMEPNHIVIVLKLYFLKQIMNNSPNEANSDWSAFSSVLFDILGIEFQESYVNSKLDNSDPFKDLQKWIFSHQIPEIEPSQSLTENKPTNSQFTPNHIKLIDELSSEISLIIFGLHTLYENYKLNVNLWEKGQQLSQLLGNIAYAHGWFTFVDQYFRDFGSSVNLKNSTSQQNQDNTEDSPFIIKSNIGVLDKISYASSYLKHQTPPNIHRWILDRVNLRSNRVPFPVIHNCRATDLLRKVCRLYNLLFSSSTEEQVKLNMYSPFEEHYEQDIGEFDISFDEEDTDNFISDLSNPINTGSLPSFTPPVNNKRSIFSPDSSAITPMKTSFNPFERVVLAMVEEGFTKEFLETLPFGISTPLWEAISSCREEPPTNWPIEAYQLIGREDICGLMVNNSQRFLKDTIYADAAQTEEFAESIKKKVTIDKEDNETEEDNEEYEQLNNAEALYINPLVFGNDKRLQHVRSSLSSDQPVHLDPNEDEDDDEGTDIQEYHKELDKLAQKIVSLPVGRGMLNLSTCPSRPTDTLVIPKIVLAATVGKKKKINITLDPKKLPLNYLDWPNYHNGVATGLRLEPARSVRDEFTIDEGKSFSEITRHWILYHKPETPSFSHAGMLLGLGLQGYLATLTRTDIYRYLYLRHDPTTVSLLLGLAASKRGTQDMSATKTLTLHIPSLISGQGDMEVSTEVQTAALIGVGLVYQGTAHRFMTELLLSELARPPDDFHCNHRESYALAAGIGLGMVTLGCGSQSSPPPGIADLDLDEKLQRFMTGGKKPKETALFNRTGTSTRILEGDEVNVHVTGPGATIALGFMYIQSNNVSVASRLKLPDTKFSLENIRTNTIIMRTICYNLVMWNSITCSEEWIRHQIPKAVMKVYRELDPSFHDIDQENLDIEDTDETTLLALRSIYANILAGCCLSLGLKYAGTGSIQAVNFVKEKLRAFEKKRCDSAGQMISPDTSSKCCMIAAMSLSCILAGHGDLEISRMIQKLQNSFEIYGCHMALGMAQGMLYLGSGRYSLSTTPSAIASLLCALFPHFPSSSMENQYHLQALRHFYVLAAENRLLEIREVDTGRLCYLPIEVTFSPPSTDHTDTSSPDQIKTMFAPSLLPELRYITKIKTDRERYWPLCLQPQESPYHARLLKPQNDTSAIVLYVKRKTGFMPYADDPEGANNITNVLQSVRLYSAMRLVDTLGPVNGNIRSFAKYLCPPEGDCGFEEEEVFLPTTVTPEKSEFMTSILIECLEDQKTEMLYVIQSADQAVTTIRQCQPNTTLLAWNLKLLEQFYDSKLIKTLITTEKSLLFRSTLLQQLLKDTEEILQNHPATSNINTLSRYIQNPMGQNLDRIACELPRNEITMLGTYLEFFDFPNASGLIQAKNMVRTSFNELMEESNNRQESLFDFDSIEIVSALIVPQLATYMPDTSAHAIHKLAECFTMDFLETDSQ
eukprot:gb/GECH01009587.1/.p1 GENE.gb/GECH01009587.1/~~gb/GECH01009587.1/.p1  ORF type:complete len:1896 (+),score=464.93 gb/GECH01009587.1/:1-5688(+)